MVDRLNYRRQVQAIFRKHGWDYALSDNYPRETGAWLINRWEKRGSLS
jgi:hypothetical protein